MNPAHTLSTFPAIVATILVVGAIVADVRRDVRRLVSGRNVVLLGVIAWFLLEAVTLSPGLAEYGQGAYDFGILCVMLSVVSFLIFYHGTPGCRLFEPAAARFRGLDDPRMLWSVVVVCGVIGFAPIAWFSGLQIFELLHDILGMRRTWGGLIGRARYGGFRDAMLMLEFFVFGAGPFAAILLLDRRSTLFQRVVCAVIAVWPLLRAFGSGTRSSLITAVLPVLAIVYLKCSPRAQRRLVLLSICLIPLVYHFMAAMVGSRNSGSFSWEAADDVNYVGNEMFQELLFITSKVPGQIDYQMGYNYYVQLVNPIPRFLWPGKPTLETGILMAKAQGEVNRRTGETYLTRSPGLIGEMYLNFGVFGVAVLSGFGGWLVRGWDWVAASNSRSLPTMVFYFMGLAALFILGRSFTMNMFYSMLFLYAGVLLLTGLAARRAVQPAFRARPAPGRGEDLCTRPAHPRRS